MARRGVVGEVQLSRDPDQALVLACQDPNAEEFEQAFEALYTRYRDRTYSIAYRIVGSSADAMDVLQEAFSILFRKIASFRFDSLFSTWLFRLVVNCAIDRRRNRRKPTQARILGDEELSCQEPEDQQIPSPIDAAASNELSRHIHDALQRLSPKLRAILVLRYLESMSYEELAATMDLSMGTVKSRLARAHLAIENVLRGTLAPFGFSELGGEEGESSPGRSGRNPAGGVA